MFGHVIRYLTVGATARTLGLWAPDKSGRHGDSQISLPVIVAWRDVQHDNRRRPSPQRGKPDAARQRADLHAVRAVATHSGSDAAVSGVLRGRGARPPSSAKTGRFLTRPKHG
jgi:hypothetical protein